MAEHRAQCQCGQLAVASPAEPDFTIACNCRACQRRTGAPFDAALYFRKAHVTAAGRSQTWSRQADSGRRLENHFCPDCGTSVFWTLDMRPDHVGVAYGCFDPPVPEPIRAIWTEEAHPRVRFPDDWPTFEKGSPA